MVSWEFRSAPYKPCYHESLALSMRLLAITSLTVTAKERPYTINLSNQTNLFFEGVQLCFPLGYI